VTIRRRLEERRELETLLAEAAEPPAAPPATAPRSGPFPALGFQARLTAGLVLAAVLPITGFGIVALALTGSSAGADLSLSRLLLFALAVGVVLAMLIAYRLTSDLSTPLSEISRAVERVAAGDLTTPIAVTGDDQFARLAESHNRLAADLDRRNQELRTILSALESGTRGMGPGALARRAAIDARQAFGLIDARVLLVDPATLPVEERVPGEPQPVRAELRAGGETMGVLVGRLPATRSWERAHQDLLELFAIEVAAGIRNAELFTRIEAQNRQLLELDEAKDDFLRGVSHNLQTPLARIRAYAGQLSGEHPDRRLGIITEQADRLSRMVRQLLTVTRIESGALRPRLEVLSLAPRVRRTWEALGVSDVPFTLHDEAEGWLAVADGDQVDQVLWALLDNAVVYGGRGGVEVTIRAVASAGELIVTIRDHGPGIPAADRARLFGRFERGRDGWSEGAADRGIGSGAGSGAGSGGAGSGDQSVAGSGLGLYVSRELCRAMGGDLALDPTRPGEGASFTITLPGELAEEG
jgi:signal transduction histidine kinase